MTTFSFWNELFHFVILQTSWEDQMTLKECSFIITGRPLCKTLREPCQNVFWERLLLAWMFENMKQNSLSHLEQKRRRIHINQNVFLVLPVCYLLCLADVLVLPSANVTNHDVSEWLVTWHLLNNCHWEVS